MLFRNCAGGIVFHNDRVYLMKNEKEEWVLPKGVVREGESRREVAIRRVFVEAGITARLLESVGETCYEFYSITRRRPVCNRVEWYLMDTDSEDCRPDAGQGFLEGGFFDHDDALCRITYTQDRSLLAVAYVKYRELCKKL